MAHTAAFSLSYADADQAAMIERSLRPEVGDIEGGRTTATLDRDGGDLRIRVAADDLVALRAGLNTWLSLATVAERAGGIRSVVDGASP